MAPSRRVSAFRLCHHESLSSFLKGIEHASTYRHGSKNYTAIELMEFFETDRHVAFRSLPPNGDRVLLSGTRRLYLSFRRFGFTEIRGFQGLNSNISTRMMQSTKHLDFGKNGSCDPQKP